MSKVSLHPPKLPRFNKWRGHIKTLVPSNDKNIFRIRNRKAENSTDTVISSWEGEAFDAETITLFKIIVPPSELREVPDAINHRGNVVWIDPSPNDYWTEIAWIVTKNPEANHVPVDPWLGARKILVEQLHNGFFIKIVSFSVARQDRESRIEKCRKHALELSNAAKNIDDPDFIATRGFIASRTFSDIECIMELAIY